MERSHAGQKRVNKSKYSVTHMKILSQPTQNRFLPQKTVKVHLHATRYKNTTQDAAVMLKLK